MRFLKSISLALMVVWFATQGAPAQDTRQSAALGAAMLAMKDGNWDVAVERAQGAGPAGADVIEWHRLRASRGTFAECRAFLERRPDWPGLPLLMKRCEKGIPDDADPDQVIAFFNIRAPQTGLGSLALIRAYRAKGLAGDAEAQLVLGWRSLSMTAAAHDGHLAVGADLLKPHHQARLDMLLWRGLTGEAERMFPLVSDGWQALANARIALRRDRGGVDGLITAVPEALQGDAGLAFERFQWRARKGRNSDAIDLLLARSKSAERLGEPERWAGWRRSLAHAEMRAGRHTRAYQVAANHHLSGGGNYAQLEWMAGYLSLRFLDQPARALDHFTRFRAAVFTPISLGRAGYWQGRALAAMGDTTGAQAAFAEGAKYQTSFYGQLAAEAAGLPMDPLMAGTEQFPPWDSAAFMQSSVLEAALILQAAGERDLAERFMVHLAEVLTRSELGALGDLALSLDEPHIAVMIGKQAARQGHEIHRAYYALHPLYKTDIPVSRELALSIARRESEFDPVVVSGAGARGMMQVMPGTARDVTGRLGIDYDGDRLLQDWGYNTRIGTAYLAQLEEEFGTNPVLVSAAYNAGPSRPRRWIRERGDPRSGNVDVVDWIEHIPFNETRNYVMRVSESLAVYRARLAGGPVPLRLGVDLHSR